MTRSRTDSHFTNALVIDDSKSFLEYFTAVLNSVGINDVMTALSGQKALAIIEQNHEIDLILCDINMPEMDGIEFLRHLAATPFDGEVIIISGEHHRVIDSTQQLARAHQLKVRGTLHKPVVIHKLESLLGKSSDLENPVSLENQHEFSVREIRKAIKKKQFVAFFQPKVEIKTRRVIGAEALCRWRHPLLGLVGAGAFIPFMETNGLIDDITDLMLDEAILFCHDMCRHHSDFTISVNVPLDSLTRLNLPDVLHARMTAAGVRPDNLIIEITESRLARDFKQALEIITRMRLKGFGLSIDDFGTGYSSMEQLQNFPFQELKIDKAFITGAAHNLASRAIIESSINLANQLDMKVVAEGVETREDWDFVAAHNCDIVQGYAISHPVAANDFLTWMDALNGQVPLAAISNQKSVNY